jgi:hypothetical protein
MSERDLQHDVRLALGRIEGLVLWRNNCGVAEHWNGRNVSRVVYGLAKGSADLVGIVRAENGIGRFVALELKALRGRETPEQRQWLALVRAVGGYSAVVRSVDEAVAAIEAARRGEP